MSTILKALEQLGERDDETPAYPPAPTDPGDPMASPDVIMPMMRRRHRRRPVWLGIGLFVAGVSLVSVALLWSGEASEPTIAKAALPAAAPAIAAVDPESGSPSSQSSDPTIQPWYPEEEVPVQPYVASSGDGEVEISDDLSDDQWAMLMLEEDPSAIGIGAEEPEPVRSPVVVPDPEPVVSYEPVPEPEPAFAVVERAPEPEVPVVVASRVERAQRTPEPRPVEPRQPEPRRTESPAPIVPVAQQVEPPPAPEAVVAPARAPRPRRAEPVLDEADRAVAGMQPPEDLAIEPEAAPEPIQRPEPSTEPAFADVEAVLDSAPRTSAASEASSLTQSAPPSPVTPSAPPAPIERVELPETSIEEPVARAERVEPAPPADEPVASREAEAAIDVPVARRELAAPPLRLASTSWHPKPERREAELAIDDMQRFVREGDQTLGYTVQEITPSSVLFAKDGETVRVRVGH